MNSVQIGDGRYEERLRRSVGKIASSERTRSGRGYKHVFPNQILANFDTASPKFSIWGQLFFVFPFIVIFIQKGCSLSSIKWIFLNKNDLGRLEPWPLEDTPGNPFLPPQPNLSHTTLQKKMKTFSYYLSVRPVAKANRHFQQKQSWRTRIRTESTWRLLEIHAREAASARGWEQRRENPIAEFDCKVGGSVEGAKQAAGPGQVEDEPGWKPDSIHAGSLMSYFWTCQPN